MKETGPFPDKMLEGLCVLLESMGYAVIVTDKEGKIRQINRVAEKLTGWNEVDARGKDLESVFRIINEESRDPVAHPTRDPLQGTAVGEATCPKLLIAKEGTEISIAENAVSLRNEQGEATGAVIVFRDRTEERAAQKALQQRAEELALLNALGREVSVTLSLEETIAAGLKGIVNVIRPDVAFLFLRQGERLILRGFMPREAEQWVGPIPEHRVGECICGLAV